MDTVCEQSANQFWIASNISHLEHHKLSADYVGNNKRIERSKKITKTTHNKCQASSEIQNIFSWCYPSTQAIVLFRQVRSTIMISGRQCSGAQWFHLVFSDLSKSFLQPSFHNLAFQIFSAAIFSQFGFSHISKSFLQPSFHSLSYHSFLNVFCIYPTFPELLTHTLFSLSLFF